MKGHATELILIFVLILLIGFVLVQAHSHNDQLAAKGMDFIYGNLGALWGLTQKSTTEKVGQATDIASTDKVKDAVTP